MDVSTKTALVASPRIKQIQGRTAAIMLLAGVVNYLDRSTLAIANPLVRQDLGLSIADMGLLLSAFLWAYAFAQLPAGAIVDRIGPRKLLGSAILLWSAAQIATGFVVNFRQFIVARVFLGIGESPSFPSFVRGLREWHSVKDRAVPTSIVCSGPSSIGPAIAPPLLTFLMVDIGWRAMVIVLGLVGIAVSVVWVSFYRDREMVGLSHVEEAYFAEVAESSQDSRVTFAGWRRLFSYRTTWGIVLGNFGLTYLQWMYLTWLPGYLEIERHISVSKTGWLASIPFLFGILGSVCGGWTGKTLMSRGVSPIMSCKLPIVVGLSVAALATAAVTLAQSNAMAIAAISFALFFVCASSGMAWALMGIVAPKSYTSSLASIQNFAGYCGGALAPTITGFVVQSAGTFGPALWTAAALGIASALAYLVVIPNKIASFEHVAPVAVASSGALS
jgi:sugar phosphate permease